MTRVIFCTETSTPPRSLCERANERYRRDTSGLAGLRRLRLALLRTRLVHCRRGDALGSPLRATATFLVLLDVLVLTLSFVGPRFLRHVTPPGGCAA